MNVKACAFAEMLVNEGPEVPRRVRVPHLAHGGVSRFDRIHFCHKEFLGRAVSDEERLVNHGVRSGQYAKGFS